MSQYVYLFHTREFFNSNKPIYKIGKTTKPNFTRFSNYPKGSVMLFQSSCRNCDELERQIIILFTTNYVWRFDLGQELFEGDQLSMIRDLCDIVRNEKVIQDEGVEEPTQDKNDENDTNNDISTTLLHRMQMKMEMILQTMEKKYRLDRRRMQMKMEMILQTMEKK